MSGEIFLRVAEILARGEPAVLVTVVAAEGAPREPGARMLVFPDGRIEGTVGGGALEHHAIQKALELLRNGPRTLLEDHTLRDLGMLCGGKTTLFYEVLQAPPTLAIFGAGHVGILLAKIAREVTPWKIVLHDDRKERESLCPKGIEFRHLSSYQDVPRFSGQTYAVIATESHETDFQVAAALLGQDPGPAYLGMLGSRAKAAEIRARLLSLGLPKGKVEALRCPVGLPLGGKDPGTVAISILSEILAFHHGARLP
jgi:xanthine dehydrogenase accessory factor